MVAKILMLLEDNARKVHDDADASNICSALLISYASVAFQPFQSSIRQAEQYACSLRKACSRHEVS